MEDSEIIGLFFERSEDAVAALSKKYGSTSMRIAENVLGKREDAEECVSDALLAVWNKIPPERPEPLAAYLFKVVRNIAINKRKQNTAQKRCGQYDVCLDELEAVLADTSSVEEELSAKELARHIDRFAASLRGTDRMLFVRRFWFMDSYEELSRLSGLGQGAVRTRIARIRRALRDHLIKEGILNEQ